jgi:hypothetical protein
MNARPCPSSGACLRPIPILPSGPCQPVFPPADRLADGLVSAAPLLKRLAALADVFEHGDLYLLAMSARLRAPLKPLLAPQPKAFTDPALRPEQAGNMQHLHDVALQAQTCDTS